MKLCEKTQRQVTKKKPAQRRQPNPATMSLPPKSAVIEYLKVLFAHIHRWLYLNAAVEYVNGHPSVLVVTSHGEDNVKLQPLRCSDDLARMVQSYNHVKTVPNFNLLQQALQGHSSTAKRNRNYTPKSRKTNANASTEGQFFTLMIVMYDSRLDHNYYHISRQYHNFSEALSEASKSERGEQLLPVLRRLCKEVSIKQEIKA